jgi:hypothetical protein
VVNGPIGPLRVAAACRRVAGNLVRRWPTLRGRYARRAGRDHGPPGETKLSRSLTRTAGGLSDAP